MAASGVSDAVELVGGPMCGMSLGNWPEDERRMWFPYGGRWCGYEREGAGKAVFFEWKLSPEDAQED